MRILLNIGLDVNGTRSLQASVVSQILAANDFRVERIATHQSNTEATAVVEISVFDLPFLAWQKLQTTAVDLQQECVAAWNPVTQKGALIGPKAKEWGEFNPQLFVLLNGKRLSDLLESPASTPAAKSLAT